jgi:hypothetical protein
MILCLSKVRYTDSPQEPMWLIRMIFSNRKTVNIAHLIMRVIPRASGVLWLPFGVRAAKATFFPGGIMLRKWVHPIELPHIYMGLCGEDPVSSE